MEGTAYSGITEVTTLLLLHRRGVDNLTNTKLHANFNVLTGEDPCTKIELSLEVNPTALGPLSGLLIGICGLRGMHQLAREYYAISATPLIVKLLACINGVTTEHFTGAPSCSGEGSHVIRPITCGSSPSLSSHTGICITVELPMDSSCAWAYAKYTARYFHLLCTANTKVEFMVSYHGNGQHRMVEYHSKDHMTVSRQGHTLMTTLHPHYHYDPSLSNRRNRLHAVWGKKQMISGITVPSGDTMTLQLSVACAAVPGLPSLARGKKLPADRLCRAIHMVVYGPGGVPVFPPSSRRGMLLSQVVNWEDYGVAIGNPCCAESTSDNFDQTVVPNFSNELVVTKDPTRASVVERNNFLYVFLFIEAVVESVDVSSTDSVGHHLRSLQMLQQNLQDIQLSHLKQFRMAFHTSLNKLLCNYNSFSKISLTLEEAIPSVSEAVASIVSHSREESFQHSCHSVMEVEPTGEEVQQWLTDRLWRIASDKLGAKYHNGQLIRAAEEPDTPDIAAITTTSHQPSLVLHDSDDTLVADVEEESVVMVSRRRCYHPCVTLSDLRYISQTDSASSQPDCVMPTDNFITLDSEDLDWSDTNCTTDSDITDDGLWSDDDTVVDDGPPWDDNDIATHSTDTVPTNTPLRNTLTCTSTSSDPLLPSNSEIDVASEDTGSTNEITANDASLNGSSESNITYPIEAPSILAHDEALEQITQDGVQVMDASSQRVLLPVYSLPEDANTCFDELADLPSSPEAMTEDNHMSSSKSLAASNTIAATGMMNPTGDNLSIIEDQYLMEQFSTISNNELDDFVDEDLDWN